MGDLTGPQATLISGGLKTIGTTAAAILDARQRKKALQFEKSQANKSNLLGINQFNINQARLAGLGAKFSGATRANEVLMREQQGLGSSYSDYVNQGNTALSEGEYLAAQEKLLANAQAQAQAKYQQLGQYKQLNPADYRI